MLADLWRAAPHPARELWPLDLVLSGCSDDFQTNEESAWSTANTSVFVNEFRFCFQASLLFCSEAPMSARHALFQMVSCALFLLASSFLAGCGNTPLCQSEKDCMGDQYCYQGTCAPLCKSNGDCLGSDQCDTTSNRCAPVGSVEKTPSEQAPSEQTASETSEQEHVADAHHSEPITENDQETIAELVPETTQESAPESLCGNGQIDANETCDGNNFGDKTCEKLGFSGGTLKCNACAMDTSACTKTNTSNFGKPCPSSGCGSGLVCVKFDENLSICTAYCDANTPCPTQPSGASCRFTLEGSGKEICGWATESGAPPVCGNNQTDAGEDCDGNSVFATCKGLGYTGGTLKCDASCKYDTSSCTGQTLCTNLPPRHCTDPSCSQIIAFTPTADNGYIALHGNTFSWLRRDAVTFVKHATAIVGCVFPNTPPLGLGDMSMQNGQTPADNGQLRHPQGTHVYGTDIDLAYYQTNTANNHLRAVCEHYTNGQDQYHCVSQPALLEPKRTAFFLANILASARVRVIGVDGKVGPKLLTAIDELVRDGLISPAAQQRFKSGTITWEETDTKRGWFYFHHHHTHISFTR